MDRKLASLLLLLALVPVASGATYLRTAWAPSATGLPAAAGQQAVVGAAVCDAFGGATDCCTGGLGATIYVDGRCPGETDLNPGAYAVGTCTVKQTGILVAAGSPNGDFFFVCGSDRDDDAFVTNIDLSLSTDADGFDDDLVGGCYSATGGLCGPQYGAAPTGAAASRAAEELACSGCIDNTNDNTAKPTEASVPVCFRADEPFAGGDLDAVFVFIGMNTPVAFVGLGTFAVDLTVVSAGPAAACGAGVNASGHTHP
jgi:hypothetical protein